MFKNYVIFLKLLYRYSLTCKTLVWEPHSFLLGLPHSTLRSKLGFLILGEAFFSLVQELAYFFRVSVFIYYELVLDLFTYTFLIYYFL